MQDWSMSFNSGKIPVYLNVYSFCHCCNVCCGWLGLGVYHTAIQIFDIQFMFHGWAGDYTGVSQVEPRTAPYRFEKQIFLGTIDYTFTELDKKIIEPLKKQFISNKYDLFNNNCNHFADALATKLGLGYRKQQGYIFRLTDCANLFRCCLPACILSGRLDWFTSKKKQQEELQEIRNSSKKYDSNSSRYQQLIEQHPEQSSNSPRGSPRMALSHSSRSPNRRPKIFKKSNQNY